MTTPISTADNLLSQHRNKVQDVRDRLDRTVAQISQHPGLTRDAKRGAIARAYVQADETVKEMKAQTEQALDRHRNRLVQRAFGNSGGDSGTVSAQREANQMVRDIIDHHQLRDMLREAVSDGDKQLAKTVAGRAWSLDYRDLVDEWNADGSHNAAVAALVEHREMPALEPFAWSGEHHLYQPREIEDMSFHQLHIAANTDYSGGDAA